MEMSYHVAFADTFHMVSKPGGEKAQKNIISSVRASGSTARHSIQPYFFCCPYIFIWTIENEL